MKISAIIIAKDAENLIADCLDSISFCDEIIVIDSGSSDRTVEIAKRMEAKVFSFRASDFSKLRNFGLAKTTSDWVFYIDVDERLSKELEESIKYKVLSIKNERISAFKIRRKNFYLGKHEWPHIEKLERLFKKSALKRWKGELHETPIFDGEVGELEGFLIHYSHRNLSEMLEKTTTWSDVEAKLRFNDNHPKMARWRFFRVMATAFFNSYIKEKGWKAGTAGLIESIYQSFSMFITYAKLWERQQEEIRGEK